MARTISTSFRGLNTDQNPSRVPSGTATEAVNVTVTNGRLQKRGGFAMFEDDVNGSAGGVTGLWIARFDGGVTYVMAKVGAVLYHRKVTATVATAFSALTSGTTHNANDRGWSFAWADRWHHFDRGGGSRWNPTVNIPGGGTVGTAYKAGLTKPSTGAAVTTATGGEKDGQYHCYWALRNDTTGEEGIVTGPATATVVCKIDQTPDISGITTSNWVATLRALHTNYEWTHGHFYCTNGNTEFLSRGGTGVQVYSHRAYDEVIKGVSVASEVAMNKADSVHDLSSQFTKSGGEPPGAEIGCWTGSRAVYGRVYASSTLVPDKMMFSIHGFPTMVPQPHTYTQSGDSKTIEPKPWRGECKPGIPGGAVVLANAGNMPIAFGVTSTHAMQSMSDGRLYPVTLHTGKGATGDGAACSTPHAAYAIGYRCFLEASPGRVSDLAENRFTTTLAEIPVAQQDKAVVAHYSYRDQIWAAVVKSGATVAQRILVWDMSAAADGEPGQLTIFEPAGLGTTESITAMVELNYGGAEPTMLVGTSAGRILQYPSGTSDTTSAGVAAPFAASWKGWWGQERIEREQKVDHLWVHSGEGVAGNVTLTLYAANTGTEVVAGETRALLKSDKIEEVTAVPARLIGRLFAVKFSSAATVSDQWTIEDISLMFSYASDK